MTSISPAPDDLSLRCTRTVARVLLRLYPQTFRRRWAQDFVEAAAHRHRRAGATSMAAVRTWLLLCADTLGAAPGTWRSGGWDGSPDGPEPRPTIVQRVVAWLAGAAGDLRTALRTMRRQPGTSLLVVITLALGIGVSAAAFAALDRVVLNPLPFEHGDRMRYLALQHRTLGWRITPEGDALPRWRQGARSLERIESYRSDAATLIAEDGPERLNVLTISIGLPGMLGVQPAAGRMLVEADAAADAPAVVMLHEAFWRRKLGADPRIVGRDLRLATGPATVAGIWPSRARLNYRTPPDLVRIMRRDQEVLEGGWTSVVGVVRDGVGDDAVASELEALLPKTADGHNEAGPDFRAVVVPPTGFVSDAYVQGLWLVFGAAVALLVVAILNAANLLLGRATTRNAEIGVRLALGGSQARILRLLGVESVVLTGVGIVLGFQVAWLTERVYAAWAPAGLAAPEGTWFAGRTVIFAAAAGAAATIAGALIPAWRARAASVRQVLSGTGTRATDASSRLRAALVTAQAALAVLLVVGASITGRSFLLLASMHPGFDVDPLAVVSVSASPARYKTPEAQTAFLRQVRDAIASLPQVQRFTVTNAPPFSTSTSASLPFFDGEPEPARPGTGEVRSQSVDAEYFAVFGTPIVAGRLFEPGDGPDAVIVNESFARAHGGSVVGRRLRFSGRSVKWYTVVGVAGDVTAGPLAAGASKDPQMYFPRQGGDERTFARFVMRVNGDPAAAIAAVRTRVAAIDPLTPLSEARTVREMFDDQTSRHRFVAYLLAGLAMFGVVFAVGGVYGVVSLEAARRRREVGVRMALGATAASVIAQMIRRGLRPVAIGAALGVAASLALGPLLKELLFRVSERDPWSAAAGVGVVIATAVIGSALPARRAAQVDPVVVLRNE